MGLLTVGETPTEWVEVPDLDGFDIKVQYLTPTRIRELRDRATRKKMNRQTRQYEEIVDDDQLAKLMVQEVIQDWRGLKLDVLEKLLPISGESRQAIEKNKSELPFSDEDLATLVEYTYARDFMEYVMDLSTDLQRMREFEKFRLEKNSKGSSRTLETRGGRKTAASATSLEN